MVFCLLGAGIHAGKEDQNERGYQGLLQGSAIRYLQADGGGATTIGWCVTVHTSSEFHS